MAVVVARPAANLQSSSACHHCLNLAYKQESYTLVFEGKAQHHKMFLFSTWEGHPIQAAELFKGWLDTVSA